MPGGKLVCEVVMKVVMMVVMKVVTMAVVMVVIIRWFSRDFGFEKLGQIDGLLKFSHHHHHLHTHTHIHTYTHTPFKHTHMPSPPLSLLSSQHHHLTTVAKSLTISSSVQPALYTRSVEFTCSIHF